MRLSLRVLWPTLLPKWGQWFQLPLELQHLFHQMRWYTLHQWLLYSEVQWYPNLAHMYTCHYIETYHSWITVSISNIIHDHFGWAAFIKCSLFSCYWNCSNWYGVYACSIAVSTTVISITSIPIGPDKYGSFTSTTLICTQRNVS